MTIAQDDKGDYWRVTNAFGLEFLVDTDGPFFILDPDYEYSESEIDALRRRADRDMGFRNLEDFYHFLFMCHRDVRDQAT